MGRATLAIAEDLVCVNPKCEQYGKAGTVVRSGMSGPNAMCCCRCCGKRFSETYGTIFHGKHKDPDLITKVLHALAEGGTIRGSGRIFGISKDTVISWLVSAGKHCSDVETLLIGKFNFTQVQVDELWSFIGKKTTHPVVRVLRNQKPPN